MFTGMMRLRRWDARSGIPKWQLALFYMSGAKPESAGASLPFLLTAQVLAAKCRHGAKRGIEGD